MNALLAVTRAVHLGSVLLLFGELVFAVCVAAPAGRGAGEHAVQVRNRIERRVRSTASWGLVVSVVSGLAWLALEAPLMSGLPPREALRGDTLAVVLTQTLFGRTWMLRACLAIGIGALLLAGARSADDSSRQRITTGAVLLAAGYAATLALGGHAAGGQGPERYLRIGADMMHLLAAGAWLGALPGLACALNHARRNADALSHAIAARTTRRFSALGTVSVGVLVLSGIANAWYLVGDLPALVATEYGRLLLAKLALFGTMLALAAVNRWRLSPRVVAGDAAALRTLSRNAALETAVGIAVIAIVGVLGITIPAVHRHQHDLQSGTSRAMITSSLAFDALHGRTHQAR